MQRAIECFLCGRALALAALFFALSACSNAVTLTGSADDGETFAGTAANDGGLGSGTIHLVSNRGLTCIGKYIYTSASQGHASMDCNNGKKGSLRFTASQYTSGHAEGVIDDRPVRFTFK